MANLRLLKIIHKEIRNEFCSIAYLSDCAFLSKNYVWNQIKLLKAMKMLDERPSNEKANVRVYRLKEPYASDYEKFIDMFSENS